MTNAQKIMWQIIINLLKYLINIFLISQQELPFRIQPYLHPNSKLKSTPKQTPCQATSATAKINPHSTSRSAIYAPTPPSRCAPAASRCRWPGRVRSDVTGRRRRRRRAQLAHPPPPFTRRWSTAKGLLRKKGEALTNGGGFLKKE